jgi:hypothetical protein
MSENVGALTSRNLRASMACVGITLPFIRRLCASVSFLSFISKTAQQISKFDIAHIYPADEFYFGSYFFSITIFYIKLKYKTPCHLFFYADCWKMCQRM